MSQTSGVLIVGHTHPSHTAFGADVVPSFQEARSFIKSQRPSILVFGTDQSKDFDPFCNWVMQNSPDSIWILAIDGMSPTQILKWNDFGPVHDLVDALEDPQLETKIQSAFEATGEFRQRRKLMELFEEQSLQLKRLSSELESRADKRQLTLSRSLRTLDHTRARVDSLLKALLGIHRAASLPQMQESLTEALRESVGIEWVRVRFENQSSLNTQSGTHILTVAVFCANENLHGEVYFAKTPGQRFSAEEVDFLNELADALGLALSRLHALEKAETVKGQWQATFDSIPHALCLTTNEFEILKINRAFQTACSSSGIHNLIGKNCFEVFLGDASKGATLNSRVSRSLGTEIEHFEVTGQSLGITHDDQSVRLVLFRSITEDVRFERRILDSSKMAELGTIGSSIAHELNNPLGGMLSFLQLILLDLKKDIEPYDEVKQMESGALRCRDIILNLLSFARKQDLGEFKPTNLESALEGAIKLVELQSKSKGIRIQLEGWSPAMVDGSANALTQVFCNLLQNSIDAISERLRENPMFPGKITIRLQVEGRQYQVQVTDNGTGVLPELQSKILNPHFTTRDHDGHEGMGLNIAYTIVNEHRGTLELLSQPPSGTTVILTLPSSPT